MGAAEEAAVCKGFLLVKAQRGGAVDP